MHRRTTYKHSIYKHVHSHRASAALPYNSFSHVVHFKYQHSEMTDLASAYCSHPIPAGVKDTINKFYRLLDIYTGTACRQWAELFTSDGEVLIEARDNLHVTGREGKHPVTLATTISGG